MLSSEKFPFMWLLHKGTLIICRYIMKKADGPFDKKALELGILDWMPYIEVLSPLVHLSYLWRSVDRWLIIWWIKWKAANHEMVHGLLLWPAALTVCEWFRGRSSWVTSDCLHSHSGPIALTVCEWLHSRSSWVSSDCLHSHCGPLPWQFVSEFMAGPVGYLLTVFTATLC